MTEIQENNPGTNIKIGFIGYRDVVKDIKRNEVFDLSSDISKFVVFLSDIACSGGEDELEDVAGALNDVLKMFWTSDARYAILIADGPYHGKKYHETTYNKFRNGHPRGLLIEDFMLDIKEINLTFYCIEIHETTKKIFDAKKITYNNPSKFHVSKLGNEVYQLSFFVSFSASKLLDDYKFKKDFSYKNMLADLKRGRLLTKKTKFSL